MTTLRNLLSALVIAILIGFGSCSNDEEEQDLVAAIVGNYIGDLTSEYLGGTLEDERIRVIKISNTEIKIEALGDGLSETILVKLRKADDGVIFTIEEQNSVFDGVLRGSAILDPQSDDVHGAYVTDTKQMAYAIWLTVDGEDYAEVYSGVKE